MDLDSPEDKQSKRSRRDPAPKFKAPTGVTVIEDDEDVVQLGMQRQMRRPRQDSYLKSCNIKSRVTLTVSRHELIDDKNGKPVYLVFLFRKDFCSRSG